jgi:hypothetical protein
LCGVEPDIIVNVINLSVTTDGQPVTALWALHQVIEVVSVSYEVHVDRSRALYDSLSTRLVEAVNTGGFYALLKQATTRGSAVVVDHRYPQAARRVAVADAARAGLQMQSLLYWRPPNIYHPRWVRVRWVRVSIGFGAGIPLERIRLPPNEGVVLSALVTPC